MDNNDTRKSRIINYNVEYNAKDHLNYMKNGYCIIEDLLDVTWLMYARSKVSKILSSRSLSVSPEWIMNVHLLGESWLLDLAKSEKLLDIIQFSCGPNIALMQSQLFCKFPDKSTMTPWHQDGRSDTDIPMITVWIALDDISPTNGGLRVIPGLHKYGILSNEAGDHYQFERVISSEITSNYPVYCYEFKAGGGAIHHQWIPHSSLPNTSNVPRRVIVLRYISSDVLDANGIDVWTISDIEKHLKQSTSYNVKQDGEYYEDYRFGSLKYFEGKCILLRHVNSSRIK